MKKSYKNTVRNSLILFAVCLMVHTIEVMFIRTDETVFAECFINKVFGITALLWVLSRLKMNWRDIGFKKEAFLSPQRVSAYAQAVIWRHSQQNS